MGKGQRWKQKQERDRQRQLAVDPATAPAALGKLAADASLQLGVHVATNPNAPLDLLLWLAERYPAQVARNPSFELHLLLQPRLLRSAPGAAAASLAGSDALLLPWLAEALAGDPRPDVRAAAAQNRSCPPALLARLCVDEREYVRERANANPSSPPGVRELVRIAGGHGEPPTPPTSKLPDEELRQLAALGPWGARLAAAHPGCPVDLLRTLARRSGCWFAVLQNPASPASLRNRIAAEWFDHMDEAFFLPHCPPAILRRIANRDGRSEYSALALLRRGDLPASVALALVRRHRRSFLFPLNVASSERVGEAALLAVLGAHARWTQVGEKLLARDDLTPALWRRLADHPSRSLRRQAAEHPRAPGVALRRLCGDADPDVRLAAWKHPSLPDGWRAALRRLGFADGLRDDPGFSPDADPRDLDALLDGGPWLRAHLALHPRAPLPALSALASSNAWLRGLGLDRGGEDDRERTLLTLRPDLPPALLSLLLPTIAAGAMIRLLDRPDLAPSLLDPALSLARRLRGSRGVSLLAALARSPAAPPALCQAAAAEAARMQAERGAAPRL